MGFIKSGESGFPRLSSLVNAGGICPIMENPVCDSSFPFASSFLPPFAAVLYISLDVSSRQASRVARERSLIPDSWRTPCGTADTKAVIGGRRSVVGCVVTRGRIRGEWTTPCYQLGASRLPRADKLLHPYQRTILVPNQADLSYTGLLFLVPSPSRHSQFVGGAKVKVSWYITV